ncbi:Dethiobiotin synthetase [hydrothermal vent metagenome]|uniref:Dethiobiotin synthetase n=1 Tax=hydrothermal vent metagenome TaxID=652676 RepID=A0A3B0RAQ5_9ZZZZ
MTRVIFVSATGTDIGKTYVTCLLLRQLHAQGYSARAIKPVISGFDENALEDSDSGLLLSAMGEAPTLNNVRNISPWRFAAPLPPHLIALQTGTPLKFDEIVSFCRRKTDKNLDFLLIEGAGGIMTPLTYEHTMLDLISQLDCACLLVCGSSLGTLSHSHTAINCLKQQDVETCGIIISESAESYADFQIVTDDFSKIFPNISIRNIRRHDTTEDLCSLIT